MTPEFCKLIMPIEINLVINILICDQAIYLYARCLCSRDALGRPSAARDDRVSFIQAIYGNDVIQGRSFNHIILRSSDRSFIILNIFICIYTRNIGPS